MKAFKVIDGCFVLMLVGLGTTAMSAHAQIYRCDNNGVIDYNNNAASAKAKNCTVASLPTITTIPAPPPPKATPASANSAGGSSSTKASGTASTGATSPASFPKVDSGTQKARDNDRAAILDEERRKESAKLQELRKEFNNGEPERRGDERNYQRYLERVEKIKDEIQRSESNIKSLEREIASVRG